MCSKHVEIWNKTYCKTKILCIMLVNYWDKHDIFVFHYIPFPVFTHAQRGWHTSKSPTVSWTTFRDWRHHVGKTAVWNETAEAEVWLRAFANTVMSHPVHQKTGTSLIVWVLPASQEKLCLFEVIGHLVRHLDHFFLFSDSWCISVCGIAANRSWHRQMWYWTWRQTMFWPTQLCSL